MIFIMLSSLFNFIFNSNSSVSMVISLEILSIGLFILFFNLITKMFLILIVLVVISSLMSLTILMMNTRMFGMDMSMNLNKN